VSGIATGRLTLKLEPCDLADPIREVVERLSEAASRAGCQLRSCGLRRLRRPAALFWVGEATVSRVTTVFFESPAAGSNRQPHRAEANRLPAVLLPSLDAIDQPRGAGTFLAGPGRRSDLVFGKFDSSRLLRSPSAVGQVKSAFGEAPTEDQ
jgi:hypothetical protein